MALTDRQAADMRMEDCVGKASQTMQRHKVTQRQNPLFGFRNGLREALPELKQELVELYAELDDAGEPPLRDELVAVVRDRIIAFIKSNLAAQRGPHAALAGREAARQISAYQISIGRDFDLAVHAYRKRKGGTAIASTSVAPPVTLVVLSVNPESGEEGEEELEVETEQVRIVNARDGSRHQSRVRIEHLPDANFTGLAKSLRLHKPTMLHVTGHGRPDGSIVLRDEQGQAYPMDPEGLARLLCVHKATLRLVVLNACYSQELADLLVSDIECVVGMASAIDDEASILFAEAFYGAIFDGASVREAFDTGVAALMARHTTEAAHPGLRCRPEVDAGRLRILE